jgi:uncharacterized protein involved in tolerance to divalent cations
MLFLHSSWFQQKNIRLLQTKGLLQEVTVQWVKFLLRILKISVSILEPDSVYDIIHFELDLSFHVNFYRHLIIKPTRNTNFSNLFWNKTLHVSDSSSVHHQELFTLDSAMVYVMQVCRQLSSRISMELLESCLQTCMTYTIAECTVNNSWWWTEELSETCRISFQNKFEKLMHLFSFIIRKFVTMHGYMNVKYYWDISPN